MPWEQTVLSAVPTPSAGALAPIPTHRNPGEHLGCVDRNGPCLHPITVCLGQ